MSCVFCRIVAGEIPSTTVVETQATLAFRDVNPIAPTHVLVIPKRHIANASEIGPADGDVLAEMLIVAKSVAAADGIAAAGYRLVFNVGEDSGNTVAHLHLHVIGGRRMGWPPFADG